MHLLKQQSAFALMELLVSIIVICLIGGFTAAFFVRVLNMPTIMLKREAFMLVNQEISRAINERNFNDTTYLSIRKNISITKRIEIDNQLYHINVTAVNKRDQKLLLSLKADVIK